MMRKALLMVTGLFVLALIAGCQTGSQSNMSKTDEDAMRKPVGQEMPPEAKAAMARMQANPGGAPPQAAQPPAAPGGAPR